MRLMLNRNPRLCDTFARFEKSALVGTSTCKGPKQHRKTRIRRKIKAGELLAARLEDLAAQHGGTVAGGAMIKQPLIQ
jgi:hypothetical protein